MKLMHIDHILIVLARLKQNRLFIPNIRTFSVIHESGGGAYLAGRSWGGLEQQLGQTPVAGGAVQGRRGVAAGYEGEGQQGS